MSRDFSVVMNLLDVIVSILYFFFNLKSDEDQISLPHNLGLSKYSEKMKYPGTRI
jgi:hypothetical protein